MIKNFYCKIYNFIAWKGVVFVISTFLIFLSCVITIVKGFNLGLDFTGGTIVEIAIEKDIDVVSIKDIFIRSGFKKVTVQRLGVHNNFIIRFPLVERNALANSDIKIDIFNILHNSVIGEFVITRISWVGPTVSSNLIKNGLLALLVAMVCILLYIMIRFEWRLAIGTVISLIHDTIIIVGILSFFSIEIDSTIVAALMSVIGYSLNDKIVIFDRIRENFFYMSNNTSVIDIFNISINQVLNRTVITSITTIMALLILLFFGGSILYGFSIILLVGVVVGTISSIYVASTLAFVFGTKRENFFITQ